MMNLPKRLLNSPTNWKSRGALLACGVLIASTVAGCSMSSRRTIQEPMSGPELKIMALGDSITAGSGTTTRVPGAYRFEMARQLQKRGDRFVFVGSETDDKAPSNVQRHEGHPGYWIDNLDEKDQEWLKAEPDIVVLMAGTNDILNHQGADAPKQMSELLKSISRAVPNAQIVLSTVTPLRDFKANVDAYNAALPGVVATAQSQGVKVRLVDAGKAITEADLSDDGVHPGTVNGYKNLGGALSAPVLEIFASRKK